jgi:predicted RNA-binding protein
VADVDFKEIAKEVDIVPLIPQLAFIKNKERWGFMFRTGFFEIPKEDFELIRERLMGG